MPPGDNHPPPVTLEIVGHVALITMCRPEARNAIDAAMARGLESSIDRVEDDPAIRVAVLGAAEPVFSAGADLHVVGDGRAEELFTERGGFAGIVRRRRSKPLIAAVDGPAVAGGLEIVLACDLVVASTAARFALPEVKRGLVASSGGLVRLAARIPRNIALEVVLGARDLTAEEAASYGLVNRVCPAGAARATATALADEVAAHSPLAVRASLAAMEPDPEQEQRLWAQSAEADALVKQAADLQEGVTAFFEGRQPGWQDGEGR